MLKGSLAEGQKKIMKKLRVGFLVDDLSPSSQVNKLIDFVNTDPNFCQPVLITGYKKKQDATVKKVLSKLKAGPVRFFNIALRSILIKVIMLVELQNAKKRYPGYGHKQKIKNLDEHKVVNVNGKWSKSGLFLQMTEEDLSLIEDCNLDCIIRCGSGILHGKILDISEYGVISFHHGDNRTNRGGPSGFWEVLNGEASSGFIIQRLNQELDGGQVLFRGNLMTSNTWHANNAQLLTKSNVFMMQLLLDLAKNQRLPTSEGVRLHGNELYKLDSSLVLLQYLIKVIMPKVFTKIVNKFLTHKVSRWSVAYCYHNNFSKSLWRYKVIKNPKGRFLADPFVIENNGENFIFVEDFFFNDGKGRISVIKVDEQKYDFLGVVLEEDFHLSFPFVFKDHNEIYMIPETSDNGDIRLYKSIEFPLKWEFERQLMPNVKAADTMLFKNEKIWFMFTNICSAKIGDHQSELHIFYSEDFKSGKWQPIESGNPVVFSPLKGRNGGFFSHNGVLYRVNQVHGQNHYGKSFNVNQIEVLSKDEYVEKEVSLIEPNFKDLSTSTHHFNANEHIAVVDFARSVRLKEAIKS